MIAPDSQRIMPVFGSSMHGTLPFGLSFSKVGPFRSEISKYLVSYGTPSSSNMIATFHGFGPCTLLSVRASCAGVGEAG